MPSQAKHAGEVRASSWKKRILALAAAAALACAAVLAVQAYTVRSLQADNVLTFGNVKIRLLETTLENGQETPVANGYADRVDADTGASRIVRVQNAGDAACWVRVRLDMEAGAEGARQDAASAVDYRYGAGVDTSDAGAQAPDALPADTWVFRADADGAGDGSTTPRRWALRAPPQSSSRRSPSTPMRLPRWAFRMIRRFTWIFGHRPCRLTTTRTTCWTRPDGPRARLRKGDRP